MLNNNLKAPTAATRVSKLPMVRSACATLSALYRDMKSNNPNLKLACDALESRVAALGTAACTSASPVLIKLEPQISFANDVACKSLDWLETTFPVIAAPTDQVVATAKNKIHEIQDVVSTIGVGTVNCVQHTVTWAMNRVLKVKDGVSQPLTEQAITVVGLQLDSALSLSEALIDKFLPPTEDNKEEKPHVEVFEVGTQRASYPARVISLTAKIYRRTCHMVGSKIQSVKMYKLSCPQPHYQHRRLPQGSLSHKKQVRSQTIPAFRMRSATMPVFENGSNFMRSVH